MTLQPEPTARRACVEWVVGRLSGGVEGEEGEG
jgi:hypothetical protein